MQRYFWLIFFFYYTVCYAQFIDISQRTPFCQYDYNTTGVSWNKIDCSVSCQVYRPDVVIATSEGTNPDIKVYLNLTNLPGSGDSLRFYYIGDKMRPQGTNIQIQTGTIWNPVLLNFDNKSSLDFFYNHALGRVFGYSTSFTGSIYLVSTQTYFPGQFNTVVNCFTINDFDNDNQADIIVGFRYNLHQYYKSAKPGSAPLNIFQDRKLCNQIIILDVNNDQWQDLYFVNEGQPNTCYINQGDLQFTESACELGIDDPGISKSAVTADFNRDGWVDIFVANYGRSRLYINQGGLGFNDETEDWGLTEEGTANAATVGDYDRDGFIDLFIARGTHQQPMANLLYHNRQGSGFEAVTASVVTQPVAFSTCAAFADYNEDGGLDLYVGNYGPDEFYQNSDNLTPSIKVVFKGDQIGGNNVYAFQAVLRLETLSGDIVGYRQITAGAEPTNQTIFGGVVAGQDYRLKLFHPRLTAPYEQTVSSGATHTISNIY